MAPRYRDEGRARFKFYLRDNTDLENLLKGVISKLAGRSNLVEIYLEDTPFISEQAGYFRDYIAANINDLVEHHKLPANSLRRVSFI